MTSNSDGHTGFLFEEDREQKIVKEDKKNILVEKIKQVLQKKFSRLNQWQKNVNKKNDTKNIDM